MSKDAARECMLRLENNARFKDLMWGSRYEMAAQIAREHGYECDASELEAVMMEVVQDALSDDGADFSLELADLEKVAGGVSSDGFGFSSLVDTFYRRNNTICHLHVHS